MDSKSATLSNLVVIDDSIQTKINLFLSDLSELIPDKDKLLEIGTAIASTTTTQVLFKISSQFNDEEWDNWKKVVDSGVNSAQQFIIMNEFLRRKLQKDINQIFNEILEAVMADTKRELLSYSESTEKISKLTDDKLQKAQELLQKGAHAELDKLLNGEI